MNLTIEEKSREYTKTKVRAAKLRVETSILILETDKKLATVAGGDSYQSPAVHLMNQTQDDPRGWPSNVSHLITQVSD